MSKIIELRRQATNAVRSRRYEQAAQLYERVCGLDGSNASYRNELGDVFLKMGEVDKAIEAFENAAELYMAVGLTNNAIAVHKKILRHDSEHLDSLWGLGEIRRQQGLEADASDSFLEFLGAAGRIDDLSREKFIDRCVLLMENLPGDLRLLSTLEEVFQNLQRREEQARVLLCKAIQAREAGELDMAEKYRERAAELTQNIELLPEALQLCEDETPGEPEAASSGSVELPPAAAEEDDESEGYLSLEDDPIAMEEGALDLGFDLDEEALEGLASGDVAPAEAPATLELPEDEEPLEIPEEPELPATEPDRLVLDDEPEPLGATGEVEPVGGARTGGPGLVDLDGPETETPETESPEAIEPSRGVDDSVGAEAPEVAAQDTPVEDAIEPALRGSVDLLEEILADDGLKVDLNGDAERQVQSIAQDVQGQFGSQMGDDPQSQYEAGIVYLDMGLLDQAAEAFGNATAGEEQRLQALEMRGSCLRKLDRHAEALEVYQEGLAFPGYPSEQYLGLLYGMGSCYEEMGAEDPAREYFERVTAVDPEFLDAQERLTRLC